MFPKVIAILATSALAGCQSPNETPSLESSDMSASTSPIKALQLSLWGVGQPPSTVVGGAAALFRGTLERRGSCLLVTSRSAGSVQPVFRAGSAEWDEATATLRYNQQSYRLGQAITLGGGVVGSPSTYRKEAGVRLVECENIALFSVAG